MKMKADRCLICGKFPIISPPFCATCETHVLYDRKMQTVYYLGHTYSLEYLVRYGPLVPQGDILGPTIFNNPADAGRIESNSIPMTRISEDFLQEASVRIADAVFADILISKDPHPYYSIPKPWIVIAEHWEAYIGFCHENGFQTNDHTKTVFAQPTKLRGMRFTRDQIAYAGRFWLNRSFEQIRDEIEVILHKYSRD
jgi:hypothetical protein